MARPMYVYLYRWQMRINGSRALRHTTWLARHLAVRGAKNYSKVPWPRPKGKFGMITEFCYLYDFRNTRCGIRSGTYSTTRTRLFGIHRADAWLFRVAGVLEITGEGGESSSIPIQSTDADTDADGY